jgi:MoaA/NifB/PqqE/SkfB family radical SAM enzyme
MTTTLIPLPLHSRPAPGRRAPDTARGPLPELPPAPPPSAKSGGLPFLGLDVLAKMGWRALTELSFNAQIKLAYLYAFKGMKAVWAYKARMDRGELFPPFMFIALTNTCNLRCHGCWVEKEGTAHYLAPDDLARMIEVGKKHNAYYYTLLGGEPFMHKGLFDILERHRDCYFQVITNGMFFGQRNVDRLARLGNVTPLISIDGNPYDNDMRRGEGVFEAASKGLERLRKAGVFFGLACTATAKNWQDVLSEAYLQQWIDRGAMYIWYYVYRPVGEDPHPEYAMTPDQLLGMRRRLLEMRRRMPLFIVDTYWTAEGEAFCPAAMGLGYHIGPQGSIEICPPLSFATDRIQDNGGDVFKTINGSRFLRGFADFVKTRTKGCVILETPGELHDYIAGHGAADYSGRDMYSELAAMKPRRSQHLPGREIPEDFWFYRFLKSQVFFGMGAL